MGMVDWFRTFVMEDPEALWMLGFSAMCGALIAIAAKYGNK